MKIRGIRLDKLLKSGLFPALRVIVNGYNMKHGTAIENSCNTVIVGNYVSLFLLVAPFVTQSKWDMLFSPIVISIIFLMTLDLRLRVRKFTKTIAELDDLLRANLSKEGILKLNDGIESTFRETLKLLAREIVRHEEMSNPLDASAQQIRGEFRRLADEIMIDLGYDSGKFNPYFDEAKKWYRTEAERPSVPV